MVLLRQWLWIPDSPLSWRSGMTNNSPALRQHPLDVSETLLLLGLAHQRGVKAVAHDRRDLAALERQRVGNRAVIVVHITAEIGRIVGIKGDDEIFVHHPPQRMGFEILHDA